MPTPTKKRLSRNWVLFVNTGSELSPVWTQLKGLTNLAATFDKTEVDTTDFDGDGWEDSLVTMRKAGIEATGFDGYTGPAGAPVEDPGQAYLKTIGLQTGSDAYVSVRLYRTDTLKGYTGRFSASYNGLGGEVKGAEPFAASFSGAGTLAPYVHTP